MNPATLNTTAPVTITVLFAPAAAFSGRVRAGFLSAPITNRARIIKISAASCGNVPADAALPPAGTPTTKGSQFN